MVWEGGKLESRQRNAPFSQPYCLQARAESLGLDEITWEKVPFFKVTESERRGPKCSRLWDKGEERREVQIVWIANSRSLELSCQVSQ